MNTQIRLADLFRMTLDELIYARQQLIHLLVDAGQQETVRVNDLVVYATTLIQFKRKKTAQ